MKSILKKYFKAFILFLAVAAGLFLYYETYMIAGARQRG